MNTAPGAYVKNSKFTGSFVDMLNLIKCIHHCICENGTFKVKFTHYNLLLVTRNPAHVRPGPCTIKHPTADYPTADYPKNILSATKKQRANQLPFAAKFGGSSAKFGESSANFGGKPPKKVL